MKKMTIENYKDFKPSEMVRSFAADLDVALATNKEMDMGSYTKSDNSECLPCLGGMAMLNFGVTMNYNEVTKHIAILGDDIRTGNMHDIRWELKELYPNLVAELNNIACDNIVRLKTFRHNLDRKEILELQQQVNDIADYIELEGV